MTTPLRSPWEIELGERFDALDPSLHRYFSVIHNGYEGVGKGVFERVGTPRKWLWPLLWFLSLRGIAYPVWEHDVPFEVRNTPPERNPADGILNGVRIFRFAIGRRVMLDQIRATERGLVDRFARGALEVLLTADVVERHLELRSRGCVLRLGALRVPLPFAPRVHLIESHDGIRQHVELTLDLPLIGRLYEYAGSFDYEVVARR